jgi:ureidoacrylate peracid hydrolase
MPILTLKTRPESLEIDLARTAVVVVDMQNAFASPGGLLDRADVDISGAETVVSRIGGLLEAARNAGVQWCTCRPATSLT